MSETEIHSPPGHFLTKKKRCEKLSSIYKSRKKMKQKQEFKKNRDQIGAFISNYRRKPRKQCDTNEKIKRLPVGARSPKNYYFTAAVKKHKQNSVVFS